MENYQTDMNVVVNHNYILNIYLTFGATFENITSKLRFIFVLES